MAEFNVVKDFASRGLRASAYINAGIELVAIT